MPDGSDRQNALRLLAGLENGGVSPEDLAIVAGEIDPVLLYVIVSFLRAVHPASDPAASPVLDRVVRLSAGSPAVVSRHAEGARDPVSRWFESEHAYRDFRGRGEALVELIVDKLES